jgi:AAA domain
MAARIDKAAFTRADMVELIGAQLPVDAPGEPRELIEQIVDAVGVRISAPRRAHEREGHEKCSLDVIMAEEARIFGLVDEADPHARLDVRADDVAGLSTDQARAVASIAAAPFLVAPLCAPAGAGKTHSLRALCAGAARGNKQVLVVAPTGKAVDEAMQDGAGDRGLTVAKALVLLNTGDSALSARRVVVVDEASMVGTHELGRLLEATTAARAKTVLVGDPYQLAPVKARGGMFEQLCDELPWTQRLSQVWRMRDPEERDASLALRAAHGNRLRKAVGWYRTHGRLHTGDEIAMAADAYDAYLADCAAGKDALLICDSWELADALNHRLHDALTVEGASVQAGCDQQIRTGDLIVSRRNDATVDVRPGPDHQRGEHISQVRNGNRWRVAGLDAATGRIAAERLTDNARAVFENDYVRQHITLGYATTVHSAQGVTAGTTHAVIGESASRAIAYVAISRGRERNHVYIYTREAGEADHEHRHLLDDGEVHQLRRGNKYAAAHYFRTILANDERPRTMHAEAENTDRELLPEIVAQLLERLEARRTARRQTWREHIAAQRAFYERYERLVADMGSAAERGMDRGYGLEL